MFVRVHTKFMSISLAYYLENSWKGWEWVGGALMDGGWEWGRGGESGRGGFARTVVGTPAIGAAYRSCAVIQILFKRVLNPYIR